MNKRNKICSALMLVLLVACVLVPLSLTERGERVFLDSDNRYATEWPIQAQWFEQEEEAARESVEEDAQDGVSESFFEMLSGYDIDMLVNQFMSTLDGYFTDRIGFRTQAMAGFALGNDVAFSVMTHPDYARGLDGYLFHSYDFYVAPEDYVELYASYVVQLQKYCDERNIPFLYVNTPSKEFIYSEYIPDYVPMRRNIFEEMQPIYDANGVNYLDLTDSLLDAKENGTQVFHVFYDPGHFNTQGAFIASNAILQRLEEMGVDIDQADLSDYEAVDVHITNLPASAYPLDMNVQRYTHLENGTQAVSMPDKISNLEYSPYSDIVTQWENDSVDNDTHLLMFQGSYFDSQGTSIQHQSAQTNTVRAYVNVLNAMYYIDIYQPDVVVFEAADYTVRDGYYNISELEAADLAPEFTQHYSRDSFELVEAPTESIAFDQSLPIANLSLPCDTEDIRYAYVEVDGVIYDCLVRDGDVHWGTYSDKLGDSQEAWAYFVYDDGSLEKCPFKITAQ